MPIGGIDEVSALIRQQTIREVERLFQFDDLRFVFLALEDAEDVSPEEGFRDGIAVAAAAVVKFDVVEIPNFSL